MHRVNKRPFNVLSSGSPYLAKLRGLRSKEVAEVLDFEIRDMVKILDEQETDLIGAKGATPEDQRKIDRTMVGPCANKVFTSAECQKHWSS